MALDDRRRYRPISAGAFALALPLAVNACAGVNEAVPPSPPPNGGDGGTYSVKLPQPPPLAERTIELQLVADLKRCDVKNPHFFYDETTVKPQAVPEMKRLASCLTTEPFSDVDLLLVGHADPRGSSKYNEDLARRRAQSVRNMLIDYGVASRRIEIATRGESGAVGDTPKASYGYDRRVDVVQLQVIHP